MTQKIGAVIVTYNNAPMLKLLLEDLLLQTRKPDEIIVIDNASFDNTASMIREFSSIRFTRLEENLGSAGGYYEGLKIACERNDFVWTLDDDMIVNEDALEVLEKWWGILNHTHNVPDEYPTAVIGTTALKAHPIHSPGQRPGEKRKKGISPDRAL